MDFADEDVTTLFNGGSLIGTRGEGQTLRKREGQTQSCGNEFFNLGLPVIWYRCTSYKKQKKPVQQLCRHCGAPLSNFAFLSVPLFNCSNIR